LDWKKRSTLLLFAGKFLLIYLVWKICSAYLVPNTLIEIPWENFNGTLARGYAWISGHLLSDLQYDVSVTGRIVRIAGHRGVIITNPCLGIGLMVLFTGFIMAFPGKRSAKWWYIPAGLLVIFAFNIFRSTVLALVDVYFPSYFAFIHLYILRGLLFLVAIGLCLLFVFRYARWQAPASKARNPQSGMPE